MTYDLSHLYKTSVLNFGSFKVTVQEIPHGRYSDSQSDMLAKINLSEGMTKKSIDKGMVEALKTKALSLGEFQDVKTIAGIQSWTLKDNNQNDVPVCIEAYRDLPHVITEQIEEGIKALNPTLDEDFPSES